ncbi:ATP-grasp domain-containing protein [Actinomyces succiniciruminis]|uniref:Biotin carboxylase n=1 Tax=Actinomyces succiniciruminis TaxID=1522002 RepID=A0A1L7RC36_9ACTO|nr:ATP-grasp domain-containing protein [Actinomyces succiniciruminis]CED91461.1 Biotin carboxylase [Actinomyces succiniciruminis]
MTVPETPAIQPHADADQSTRPAAERPPVLILGGSPLQVPMIRRARDLGLRTLVVDANPNVPGAALADEFAAVSTTDVEGLLALTRDRELAGVTSVGTDRPVRAMAAVAQAHGLPAVSPDTAAACTDKALMLQAVARAGVPHPRFALATDLDELRAAVAQVGLPCIVKPLDSSGSRGVVQVDSEADLARALDYALAPSYEPTVIVEELLVGREISCEVLCVDGTYHVVATTDKDTTGSPHFIETGHTQPADLDADTLTAAHALVAQCLAAVDMHFGPAHVEMMLTDNGPVLIEFGCRMAGDFVSSHVVPGSTGIDFIGLVLRQACGEKIEVPASSGRAAAIRFLTAPEGVLRAFHGVEEARAVPGVDAVITLAQPGEAIAPLHSSTDRLGVVVASAPDRVTAVAACERARDLIRIEVDAQLPSPAATPAAASPGPASSTPGDLPARGRRVLIIGAGRGQLGLIRAVKRLGATAVVASLTAGPPPGLKEADEAIDVNLLDPDAVAREARLAGVDAVATSCLDTGLEALGAVVDELGLRGIGRAAARLCMDKLAMKRRLVDRGVSTAPFREVTSRDELDAALAAVGLPAMVKAADLQGSSGVFKVASPDQARAAFDRAHALSRHGTVIVERFLDGREFGAQALVHDGELIHVTVHGDDLAVGLPIPIGHHVPLDDADLAAQAREVTAAAVAALGLDDCAVNIDLMACDGQVYVIELTGRAGANGLPELMGAVHGLDYYELVAREALDLDVPGTWARREPGPGAALALMLTDPDAHGTIADVLVPRDLPDWAVDLSLFRGPGDRIDGFASSNDCLGQVVVRGHDLEQCRQRAAALAAQVTFRLQEAA